MRTREWEKETRAADILGSVKNNKTISLLFNAFQRYDRREKNALTVFVDLWCSFWGRFAYLFLFHLIRSSVDLYEKRAHEELPKNWDAVGFVFGTQRCSLLTNELELDG